MYCKIFDERKYKKDLKNSFTGLKHETQPVLRTKKSGKRKANTCAQNMYSVSGRNLH